MLQYFISTEVNRRTKKRNMEGFYCKTKDEALQKVIDIIPKDSMVSCGGSATLHEIGVRTALKMETTIL